MPAAAAQTKPRSDHDILAGLNADLHQLRAALGREALRRDPERRLPLHQFRTGRCSTAWPSWRSAPSRVAIRNLRAEDVLIRYIGDSAIIHARTAYTKPDGNARRRPLHRRLRQDRRPLARDVRARHAAVWPSPIPACPQP